MRRLARSSSSRLISAGLPAPSHTTTSKRARRSASASSTARAGPAWRRGSSRAVDVAERAAHHEDLTAGARRAGLSRMGFMVASGSTPAASRLQRLGPPDLAAVGGDVGVEGHVLGLERRHPHAPPGQPGTARRHDALPGVRRRAADQQRAPHRADTLPAPIGLPPARVEPAHLRPAAARRHRAPAAPAARVEEQPAAVAAPGSGARARGAPGRRAGRPRRRRRRSGRARVAGRPVEAPGAVAAAASRAGGRRLGVVAGERSRSAGAAGAVREAEKRREARRAARGRPRARPSGRAGRPRRRGAAPSAPDRVGHEQRLVLDAIGSPSAVQSTLLAKSRQSAPPRA